MSNVGFVVRGDHGLIQIDANYRGLKLIKTVTLSPLGSSRYAYYEMNYTPTPMVRVAFRETTGLWFRPLWHVGPAGWYEHVPPSGAKMSIYCETRGTSSLGNIQAYIYDVPQAPPSGMIGMVIYDASGNVVFDTEGQYMRVQSFVSGRLLVPQGDPPAYTDGPIAAHPLPSGNYAVCPVSLATGSKPDRWWQFGFYYINFYRIASNSVETRLTFDFAVHIGAPTLLSPYYSAMILKV